MSEIQLDFELTGETPSQHAYGMQELQNILDRTIAELAAERVESLQDIKAFFELRGFSKRESSGAAFICETYVIKFNYWSSRGSDDFVPMAAVPTIKRLLDATGLPACVLDCIECYWSAKYVTIQPTVDTGGASMRAWDEFQKLRTNDDLYRETVGYDCRLANIGMYLGKPVVFDW